MLDPFVSEYLAAGIIPLPIPTAAKRPVLDAWEQTTLVTAPAAFAACPDDRNVGLLLGPSGIVDVDLDVKECLPFARAFLPPTACYGRPDNPESHWLYRCPDATMMQLKDVRNAADKDPETRHQENKMIVELRAGNAQSVAPPSVHPSGESIAWVRPLSEMITIEEHDLRRRVALVFAGALLARHWPAYGRHEAQLALAGGLCKAGLPQEDAATFLVLVCAGAKDGDASPGKREATIRDTYAKQEAGLPIASWPALAELVGKEVVDKVKASMGSTQERFILGDHLELAQRILAQYPTGEILSAEGETWSYERATGLWAPLPAEVIVDALKRFHRAPVGSADKPRMLKIDHREVSAVPKVFSAITAKQDAFARAPNVLAFLDCVISLDTAGEYHADPSAPTHYQRHGFDFRFADAQAPTFERFLSEVLAPEDVPFLQEWAGAALFGLAPTFGTAVVFLGSGANGKSTLAGAIESLFPAGSTRAVPPQRWAEDQHLARLVGAKLNVVGEMPGADIASTDIVKAVITGDLVQAKRVYKEPFQFRPQAAHLFLANTLPPVRDLSPGFWRRFAIVQFPADFRGRSDVDMPRKLRAERPGIARWALEGAQRAVRQGRLSIPESSVRLVEEWRAHADAVTSFVTTATKAGKTQPSRLFAAFQTWSRAQGFAPLSLRSFGDRLKLLGYPPHKSHGTTTYPLDFDPGRADRDDGPALRLVPGGAS